MTGPALADDIIYRFGIDGLGAHGRLVRLGAAATEILDRYGDAEPVAELLGELLAATAALGAAIKFDGRFVAQARGDGPVGFMIAEYGSGGTIRGYARADQTPTNGATRGLGLLGRAHMALIVDQGPDTERYEGIVALDGDNLGSAMDHYFAQSEQINGLVRPVARRAANGAEAWRAGCLLVEQTPEPDSAIAETPRERWRHVREALAGLDPAALVDADINPLVLIDSLFTGQGVRVFEPVPVRFECHCSDSRAEAMIEALPARQRRELTVDGVLSVVCEFCGAQYEFDGSRFADASD